MYKRQALSFIGAIPLVGIPFNLIDIGRDVGLFEEGGALDWLDFLDWFRLNKDNPNYVDKRTAEEKEIDEDLDVYLREEYEKSLREYLERTAGTTDKTVKRKRTQTLQKLNKIEDLSSDELRSLVGKEFTDGDIKFFGKNKSSYNEIRKFLDNIESSKINTNNSVSTTIINNPNQYLIPFNTTIGSTENLSGSFNFNVNTSIVDFNYGEFNSLFTDELFQLKLDK